MPESFPAPKALRLELALLAVLSLGLATLQSSFAIDFAPRWIAHGVFGLPVLVGLLHGWRGLLAVLGGNALALLVLSPSLGSLIALLAMTCQFGFVTLLERTIPISPRLATPRAVCQFVLLVGLSALARCNVVALGCVILGMPAWDAALGTLTVDWLVSLLLVPAALIWLRGGPYPAPKWLHVAEFLAVVGVILVITGYFYGGRDARNLNAPVPLLAIFIGLGHWVAFRYSVRGMTTLFLAVVGVILYGAVIRGTLSPVLPAEASPAEQHLWLAALGVLVLFHLILAALAKENQTREHERETLRLGTQKHADRLCEVNGRLALQSLEIADQAVELQRQRDEFERIAQELAKNQQRLNLFESAVVNAQDAIIILEPTPKPKNGRAVLYVNDAFTRMTGYSAEEVVGRSLHMLRGEKTDAKTLLGLRHALDNKTPFSGELQNYHKSGTSFWVSIGLVPVQNAEGICTHFVMIQRDITDRKVAQEALTESEVRFRSIFETASAGVSLTNAEGKFTACNPAFAELLGRPLEDILNRSPQELSHPDDWEAQQPFNQAMLAGHRDKYQMRKRYVRPNGSLVWVELTLSAVRDANGRNLGSLGVSVDISARMTLEEQLRQSQKMEALGQLAGGVAHDFNNLLTAVLGNLALVQLPDDSPQKQLLATVELAATRAADLTRKLLGYARRNQLLVAPVTPGAIIAEVVEILRRTIDPRIEIHTKIRTPELVSVDSTLLNQALFNLCLNARDAMPHGGTLTLEADKVTLDGTQTLSHPDAVAGTYIRIRVSDTGQGMDNAVKQRLFEPFFTTKGVGRGTGLGLPMVHGILKQHQGWVTFDSELGRGTQFDLYLPLTDELPSLPSPSRMGLSPSCDVNTPPPAKSNATILLVDDEDMIRTLGRTILESNGYQVLEAIDGLDGVEQYLAHSFEIDLVILDVTMPRLSGPDAFQQIISHNPNVRVMFSSGFSREDISDIEGTRGVLMKPYRPKDLLSAVHRVLNDIPLTVKLAE